MEFKYKGLSRHKKIENQDELVLGALNELKEVLQKLQDVYFDIVHKKGGAISKDERIKLISSNKKLLGYIIELDKSKASASMMLDTEELSSLSTGLVFKEYQDTMIHVSVTLDRDTKEILRKVNEDLLFEFKLS